MVAGASRVVLCACLFAIASYSGANWQPRSDMLFPHQAHRAEVVDGRIYVLGGRGPQAALTHEIEMYDPETGAWSHVGDMPGPRSIFGTAVWDGAIYVFGGNGARLANLKSVVERYDPATGLWTRLADMPIGRSAHTAQVVGDSIYIVGDSDRVDRYDPVTDTWSQAADIPMADIHFPTASVGGKLYVFGAGQEHDEMYEYDPDRNRWSQRRPMPTPRAVALTTVVGGEVYIIGGFLLLRGGDQKAVQIYSPENDAWRAGPDTTNNHAHGAAVSVRGVIYALSGEGFAEPASRRVEAWDTGIRAVEPSAQNLLTTWSALRSQRLPTTQR